ncbi:MAG: cell division protein FtsA [Akkermansia sp.]
MAQTKIHVGLEIGTSKTCMVVGEVKPDATVTIIGVGEVKSAGVTKGEVADPSRAIQCIYDAWVLAQDHADVEIITVYLAVTGSHIVGVNNRGTYRLPEDENIISREHMEEVSEIAQDIPLNPDQFALHRVPGFFSVDGQEGLSNPEGLSGRTIDIDCHIIHGMKTRITNSLRCVREVPLEVEDVVFAPLATAQYVLSRQCKQAGALLIDMGGGTTDYALYVEGQLVASGCVPIGGDHITNDIHLSTGIPWVQAELLKKTEGDAFGAPGRGSDIARVPGDAVRKEAAVERALLNKLIQDRILETLKLVKSQLPDDVFKNHHCSEVYMCGGASMMRGVGELASRVFGVPINQPSEVEGTDTPAYLDDPRFATAIGLIRYAQILDAEVPRKTGFFHSMKNLLFRSSR